VPTDDPRSQSTLNDSTEEAPLNRFLTKIEIDAARNIPGRSIDLYVTARRPGWAGMSVMVTPVFQSFERAEDAFGVLGEPSFHLTLEAAQRLMDELWRCGIRPTEEGTAGQVAAMQAHLQDMRKLVFDLIGRPPIEINRDPDSVLRDLERFNSAVLSKKG